MLSKWFSSTQEIILEYARALVSMQQMPQVNLTEVDHEYEHGRISEQERDEAYRIAERQIAEVEVLEQEFIRKLRWRWWGYRQFWEALGPQIEHAFASAPNQSFRKALLSDLLREKQQMDQDGTHYYSPWFWRTWYTEVYLPGLTPPPAPAL